MNKTNQVTISVRMNKKQRSLIGITTVLLFTWVTLATSTNLSTSSSDVVIYAFDQNPAGRDEGDEWVALYNPYLFRFSPFPLFFLLHLQTQLVVWDIYKNILFIININVRDIQDDREIRRV
jgi:hypothetical protein